MTDAQIAAGRDELREEMTAQRRDRFFSAYMQKAKTSLKININQDTLAQVLGTPRRPGLLPSSVQYPAPASRRSLGALFTRIHTMRPLGATDRAR